MLDGRVGVEIQKVHVASPKRMSGNRHVFEIENPGANDVRGTIGRRYVAVVAIRAPSIPRDVLRAATQVVVRPQRLFADHDQFPATGLEGRVVQRKHGNEDNDPAGWIRVEHCPRGNVRLGNGGRVGPDVNGGVIPINGQLVGADPLSLGVHQIAKAMNRQSFGTTMSADRLSGRRAVYPHLVVLGWKDHEELGSTQQLEREHLSPPLLNQKKGQWKTLHKNSKCTDDGGPPRAQADEREPVGDAFRTNPLAHRHADDGSIDLHSIDGNLVVRIVPSQ